MSDASIIVAIDGPSASGKSTVSRKVAEAMGWIYIDSGSLYRGMTWHALDQGVNPDDAEALVACLETSEWDFESRDRIMVYHINGQEPGGAIRSPDVAAAVSKVAAVPEIRHHIVENIRAMAQWGSLVVEGRDIASVVFPDAPFKFYLDADPDERARRRAGDQHTSETENVDEVLDALARRDELDSTRETAPLQVALGAEVINSTGMSIDDVVEYILGKVRA